MLLLLSPLIAGAAPTDATGYSDWYQVEIIVFAQRNPSPSDETWSATPDLEYPANMLAIAPRSAKSLKPDNLSELTQLLSSTGDDTQAANSSSESQENYMFADKSRFQQAPATQDSGAQQEPRGPAAQALQADVTRIFNADLPHAFRALPHRALQLNSVAGIIERSSLYRLLLHVGWLQPIPEGGNSWPVLIQAGDRYADDYEVDGTLTVSRARYLHVDTDLWFTRFKRKYDEEPPLPAIVTNLSPAIRARYPLLVAAAEKQDNFEKVQTYTMTLSRRMRSATLHYLDNPYFGVLIEVDEFNYTPPGGAQSTSPTSSPSK